MGVLGAQLFLNDGKIGYVTPSTVWEGLFAGEGLQPIQRDLFCSASVGTPSLPVSLSILATDGAGH